MSLKENEIFCETAKEAGEERLEQYAFLFDADACQSYIGRLMRDLTTIGDLTL